TREGPPHLLVDRPVQPAVLGFECVHHHQHHFLAVLAFVPFFPTFLGAAGLALLLAAMTLTTALTAFLVPARTAALGQLCLSSHGRTFAVHLDDQHLAVIAWRCQLLHERRRLPAQPQDNLLDGLRRRRPAQHRYADQSRRGETHARRQACHQ